MYHHLQCCLKFGSHSRKLFREYKFGKKKKTERKKSKVTNHISTSQLLRPSTSDTKISHQCKATNEAKRPLKHSTHILSYGIHSSLEKTKMNTNASLDPIIQSGVRSSRLAHCQLHELSRVETKVNLCKDNNFNHHLCHLSCTPPPPSPTPPSVNSHPKVGMTVCALKHPWCQHSTHNMNVLIITLYDKLTWTHIFSFMT